jgi:hypothetical protein
VVDVEADDPNARLTHSNMHDFAKDMGSLVPWICEQLPTSWSLRKSVVDCLAQERRAAPN